MAGVSIEVLLQTLDSVETLEDRERLADNLEEYIEQWQREAAGGAPSVPDGVYDACCMQLRVLRPQSRVLHRVWSEDENPIDESVDQCLMHCPMTSITTIKDFQTSAYKTFRGQLALGVQLLLSLKINGHGIRIVYKRGKLVKAWTRGRSSNGRDITAVVRVILGNENALFRCMDSDIIEIRAEVALPFESLNEARKYNPNIVNAFTAVASLIRASGSDDEYALLKIVAYDILCYSETEGVQTPFDSLLEKFEYLESAGFTTPDAMLLTVESDLDSQLLAALDCLERADMTQQLFTDGVVVSVNSLAHFDAMGESTQGVARGGNIAIKMGFWEQNFYTGVVGSIVFERGKVKLTPVAVLAEPVLTASGSSVSRVPLHAPVHILSLSAYPGELIHFRYGGESGVLLCRADGTLVSDDIE